MNISGFRPRNHLNWDAWFWNLNWCDGWIDRWMTCVTQLILSWLNYISSITSTFLLWVIVPCITSWATLLSIITNIWEKITKHNISQSLPLSFQMIKKKKKLYNIHRFPPSRYLHFISLIFPSPAIPQYHPSPGPSSRTIVSRENNQTGLTSGLTHHRLDSGEVEVEVEGKDGGSIQQSIINRKGHRTVPWHATYIRILLQSNLNPTYVPYRTSLYLSYLFT